MKEHDVIQGSEEWAQLRRGRPTASCFDKIITPAKGELSKSATDYACQLIAETMTPPHYWIGNDYQSGPMANGSRTEREARDYLEMQLNQDIRQVGFVTTDDGSVGASPDGLIDPSLGVELKCPEHKRQIRYLIDGVLPVEYRPQVHGNMLVTGRSEWLFMSYAVGLPPLIVPVKVDEFTQKLAEALQQFLKLLTDLRSRIEASGDPVAATRTPYTSPF
jgi:hypothetical protein